MVLLGLEKLDESTPDFLCFHERYIVQELNFEPPKSFREAVFFWLAKLAENKPPAKAKRN